ncbi:MAG: hypothetical protein AB7F86_18940 [Bdellovibrionales bacterium]
MKNISLVLVLTLSGLAQAADYRYNELIIKDYDEMQEMVQVFIDQARAAGGEDGTGNEDEAISQLREALKLIYSRPNSDNMVAKLVPEARRVLVGYNAYESTVRAIAEEAVGRLKQKDGPVTVQSTSLFILDNILADIRPECDNNAQLRQILEVVRDAKIRVPKEVVNERKVRGMFNTKNPSDLAGEILKDIEKRHKDHEKETKKKRK